VLSAPEYVGKEQFGADQNAQPANLEGHLY
jgi:hypothetical protein